MTVVRYGYAVCAQLTLLKIIWLSYPGREMLMEVVSHMKTCCRCLFNNNQAIPKYRKEMGYAPLSSL